MQAIISSRRLSRFLSCPEHRREVGENSSCSSSFLSKQPDSLQDLAVFIQDACCSWSSSDEKAINLVLNHVTLSLSKGSFVAVIGEVRSLFEFRQYLYPIKCKQYYIRERNYNGYPPITFPHHNANVYLKSLVQNMRNRS